MKVMLRAFLTSVLDGGV